MVKLVYTMAEFNQEIDYPGLVVVDFFAEWCGPCKKIAPFIESLVLKYPDVKFLKVDVDNAKEIAQEKQISAMPTFHFYVKGKLAEEMKGANPDGLEQKVIALQVNIDPFAGGSGHKLSAESDPNVPAMSAREARLLRMEGPKKAGAPKEEAKAAPSAPSAAEEEEALAQAMKLALADKDKAAKAASASDSASARASTASKAQDDADLKWAEDEWGAESSAKSQSEAEGGEGDEEEMVPVPVNEELLAQLVDMGFSEVRARKSLVHGGSLEGALGWLTDHQDDPDIDQPYLVRKSDTIPKPPLTEEEKAQKLQDIQNKIEKRRQERKVQDKADEIKREKERRERGKNTNDDAEERQRLARKREAEKMKREKMEADKEKKRLLAEIAADKEIRRKNKGVLPSVLGVDGYNPTIGDQSHVKEGGDGDGRALPAKREAPAAAEPKKSAGTSSSSSSSSSAAKKSVSSSAESAASTMTPEQRVDNGIQTIMRYRTMGDGGKALGLLRTFVKNIVHNPGESKYRAINTESNAFKTKLGGILGPMVILKALDFEKSEEDGKLYYKGAVPSDILTATANKLVEAEAVYKQMNP